jgi:short-subunit dehydrogenase
MGLTALITGATSDIGRAIALWVRRGQNNRLVSIMRNQSP